MKLLLASALCLLSFGASANEILNYSYSELSNLYGVKEGAICQDIYQGFDVTEEKISICKNYAAEVGLSYRDITDVEVDRHFADLVHSERCKTRWNRQSTEQRQQNLQNSESDCYSVWSELASR